jgi:anti-anti-sigma regulatory factor
LLLVVIHPSVLHKPLKKISQTHSISPEMESLSSTAASQQLEYDHSITQQMTTTRGFATMTNHDSALLDCRIDQDVLVVQIRKPEVSGEELAVQLKADLLDAVKQHDAKLLVIDFQKVKYMTSRPYGAIAGFSAEFVRNRGGKMALCGLTEYTRESLSALHFITGGGTGTLIRPGAGTAPANPGTPEKPSSAPLFDIVTEDVPSAIAALKNASS